MKYVPDLIPAKSRVTWDDRITIDNKGIEAASSPFLNAFAYVAAGVFFIGVFGIFYQRQWEGVICVVMGCFLLPPVHHWLEHNLSFKFTWKIKSVWLLILGILLAAVSQYNGLRLEEADALRLAEERARVEAEAQRQAERDRKEKAIADSVNYYVTAADTKIKSGQYQSAVRVLSAALVLSTSEQALQKRAECYVKLNMQQEAISDYSDLIRVGENTSLNYYNRALCYNRLGNRQQAVLDLKNAIELGNTKAKSLYEKINPLKRRVLYYVTRCCDGSTSSATGRGACSHHGGVCNWNDPVYQEYRDY